MFGGADKEIIYPDPGFPIYRSMIKFSGAKPVPIDCLFWKEPGMFEIGWTNLELGLAIVNAPGFRYFPAKLPAPASFVAAVVKSVVLAPISGLEGPNYLRVRSDKYDVAPPFFLHPVPAFEDLVVLPFISENHLRLL